MSNLKSILVRDLFDIKTGNARSFEDYHEVAGDDFGDIDVVAYVSASTNSNGVNGYVIPSPGDNIFDAGMIAVANQGDGSVSFATLQMNRFIAAATIYVLIPKRDLSQEQKLKIAAVLRKNHWRFSFGRKVDQKRLGSLEIPGAFAALHP